MAVHYHLHPLLTCLVVRVHRSLLVDLMLDYADEVHGVFPHGEREDNLKDKANKLTRNRKLKYDTIRLKLRTLLSKPPSELSLE